MSAVNKYCLWSKYERYIQIYIYTFQKYWYIPLFFSQYAYIDMKISTPLTPHYLSLPLLFSHTVLIETADDIYLPITNVFFSRS